jgi:catechol 2,3-dioxygenase-like lactoylglutathione lyase family enzyme
MDNVAIVVDDLDAAVAFFAELGMELEGKGQVEGLWADRTVGLDGVRSEIAMMRTPDGHSKLELTRYHTPAASAAEPENPPPNTLGLHRVMFAVDDIDDTVARLRAHGAELLGEVAQYESIFRLCYLRGPAGIIVALAEQIGCREPAAVTSRRRFWQRRTLGYRSEKRREYRSGKMAAGRWLGAAGGAVTPSRQMQGDVRGDVHLFGQDPHDLAKHLLLLRAR